MQVNKHTTPHITYSALHCTQTHKHTSPQTLCKQHTPLYTTHTHTRTTPQILKKHVDAYCYLLQNVYYCSLICILVIFKNVLRDF